MNEIIFFIHTLFIATCTVGVWFLAGKKGLAAYICVLSILANLFVTKQITLFGMHVTGSDAFIVGGMFGLNLLQEFYGKAVAQKAIVLNFALMLFYVVISQIHLLYTPNSFDIMHQHFQPILHMMPRITIASLVVFFIAQQFDAQLFYMLKKLFKGKYAMIRNTLSLSCSQLLDTTLFSFFALYGVVANITHIIIVSFCIKMLIILLTAPFMSLAKKINAERLP